MILKGHSLRLSGLRQKRFHLPNLLISSCPNVFPVCDSRTSMFVLCAFFHVKQSLHKITQSAWGEETTAQMMTLPRRLGNPANPRSFPTKQWSHDFSQASRGDMETLPLRTAPRCIFPPFSKCNTHLTHLPLCGALSQQHLQSRSDITLALMLIAAPAVPADFSTTCLKPQSSAHRSLIEAILFFLKPDQLLELFYSTGDRRRSPAHE